MGRIPVRKGPEQQCRSLGRKLERRRTAVATGIITFPTSCRSLSPGAGVRAFPAFSSSLMKILLVEDDAEISASVARGLRRAGYQVDCADDGLAGERMARSATYDAAIVDLMLPGQDGLTLINHLREYKLTTPIIVLSAKRSSSDKVTCLRRGADDYLSKPFELPELIARIEAVLRRTGDVPKSERLENSGVVLD